MVRLKQTEVRLLSLFLVELWVFGDLKFQMNARDVGSKQITFL